MNSAAPGTGQGFRLEIRRLQEWPKGNRISGGEAVPRCEAACAVCAQKDYFEHRHKLSLFGAVPEERVGAVPEERVSEHCADAASDQEDVPEGEADARRTRTLVKHRGVYYLQSPEMVQRLLDVDRYRQRWPLIPPEEMQIVRERKQQCATFSQVSVRDELAATRLPEDGVPEHIQSCLQAVDGADKAPVRLLGPASRAPEVGKEEEAGEESEEEQEADSDGAPAEQPDLAYLHENVAETTVAVDPVHHVGPVRMMQALQGTLEALPEQAARIAKTDKTPTVADSSGALQPVADEGGSHTMRSMVLDVQSAVPSFYERSQVELEKAQAGADTCRMVGPQSLSVPTQSPLSSFDSRSWPACYVEFWFGDGAPNLERERPMLFEQVYRATRG